MGAADVVRASPADALHNLAMDDAVVLATRRGIRVRADAARIDALRDAFARDHVIRLPHFLEHDLLARVQDAIDDGAFIVREDAGIAVELCLEPSRALDILMFVMNAPQLFELVRAISGCSEIGAFSGRIYRFDPTIAHHDSWHDDTAAGGRLVGCSLNLSRERYSGGAFQLRAKASPEDVIEIDNNGSGDAFLFRIAPELQHRVLPVSGAHPKTAFAGWFLAK